MIFCIVLKHTLLYNQVMADSIRKYIWIELFVWVMLLCFLIAGIRYHSYKEQKKLVTYQIFIPDVDGLIVGSPVKFMGVQIGYIDKVKIVSDVVYLKILITEKNIKLPKGSIATVEFSGMGGSKSLEIYPPTKQSIAEGKIIAVQDPVRLNDALSLLSDMFDKINSITLKMSFFANETGVVDVKNGVDINAIENNVDTADKIMKRFNKGENNEQSSSN